MCTPWRDSVYAATLYIKVHAMIVYVHVVMVYVHTVKVYIHVSDDL